MRYFLHIFFLTVIAIALCSYSSNTNIPAKSAGAPTGATGAPLEKTCATSGCHDFFTLNSGAGTISFEFNNNKKAYGSGYTYTVKINVTDGDTLTKYGFQMVAIQDVDTVNAGTFNITNAFRTQKIEFDANANVLGNGDLEGRVYVTHTFEGAINNNPGSASWSFDWTAPENYNDSITFYLAVLSTNDNLEMYGDYTYTTTLKIGLDPFAAVEENKLQTNSIIVFPNPANELINVEYEVDKSGLVEIGLYDLTGQKVKQLLSEYKVPGNYKEGFVLQDGLPSGLYFLKITVSANTSMRKIFVKS